MPIRRRCCCFLAFILPLLWAGCGGDGSPKTIVRIETTPPGAELLIGGLDRGATPIEIPDLAPGRQDLVLKKNGYERLVDHVTVAADQAQTFSFTLEPQVGFLTLSSEPPGATVKLADGTVLGKTPLKSAPVPVGLITYSMELHNYYPETGTVEVQSDFEYAFPYLLKPMECTLVVTSRPSGCSIWINNEIQPQKTPTRFTLAPGLYIISAHTEGYVQADEKIELKPQAEHNVTLRLVEGDVPAGMMLVPAGPFMRGEDGRAPDESPQKDLQVEAYYIDKFEVTNADYKAVFPLHTFPEGLEQFPVSGVSWTEAVQYAEAVNKRLPTEIEWEKAARGSDGREFPWGDTFDVAKANIRESNERAPVRVGSYIPGIAPYGCLDMSGNVYEWTQDWYQAYPENTVVTEEYGQVFRVLRGGSYQMPEFNARCAVRHFDRMEAKRADYGFRCARNLHVSKQNLAKAAAKQP